MGIGGRGRGSLGVKNKGCVIHKGYDVILEIRGCDFVILNTMIRI